MDLVVMMGASILMMSSTLLLHYARYRLGLCKEAVKREAR